MAGGTVTQIASVSSGYGYVSPKVWVSAPPTVTRFLDLQVVPMLTLHGLPGDEFFRSDRLRLVAGTDQHVKMAIRSDDPVRTRNDGAVGEGIVIRIARDGVKTAVRADMMDGAMRG